MYESTDAAENSEVQQHTAADNTVIDALLTVPQNSLVMNTHRSGSQTRSGFIGVVVRLATMAATNNAGSNTASATQIRR
jgi:hypothetical protein